LGNVFISTPTVLDIYLNLTWFMIRSWPWCADVLVGRMFQLGN